MVIECNEYHVQGMAVCVYDEIVSNGISINGI